MASLLQIWRFDGPRPSSPDDPCLDGSPWLEGLVERNPAVPFGPPAELRAVFDRHVPRLYWNAEGTGGFARQDKFQFHVLLASGIDLSISLAIDEWQRTAEVLRAIEAEQPDWHVTWTDGRWLRDVPDGV
ncbi:hypothetical protein [Maliponia aquimaris]|uniref:Uncharacterized protein n=1 Tax=Maliponia aquimaris TaxID=1673631 RepID=A0A238L0M6_9RHOB|nr:hypothetical protein [Maliponia aquimaris]SMX48645.1 hypothetical protein MAA8898_04029 [Maliponia aquimaris]